MKVLAFCPNGSQQRVGRELSGLGLFDKIDVTGNGQVDNYQGYNVFWVVAKEFCQSTANLVEMIKVEKNESDSLIFEIETSCGIKSIERALQYEVCECFNPQMSKLEKILRLTRLRKNKEQIRLLKEAKRSLTSSVMTDNLTGLCNRGMFDHVLKVEHERLIRQHVPFSLLILDLDLFKSVNDTYGHVVGDGVLQVVSKSIGDTVRTIDVPCRYGGEEFAVILPGICLSAAQKVAERIRVTIGEIPMETLCGPEQVTASIGVCSSALFGNDANHHLRLIVECADKALYQAKADGRNRVVAYESLPVKKGVVHAV